MSIELMFRLAPLPVLQGPRLGRHMQDPQPGVCCHVMQKQDKGMISVSFQWCLANVCL